MTALARRSVLAGGVMLPLAAARAQGVDQNGAMTRRLLVAGPEGGVLDALAARLSPALLAEMPPGTVLLRHTEGGADGVTGANAFDARGGADDADLLLLPGSAVQAWLGGDSRVRFDPAAWLPLLCGIGQGVLLGRRPLTSATPQRPLVIAVPDPLGPAGAALLGLDLLNITCEPRRSAGGPTPLLRDGLVDAVCVDAQEEIAAAAAVGGRPLCTLAGTDVAAGELPSMAALLRAQSDADPVLASAWNTAAAVSVLDYALVMAPLTPAADVAQWRRAAQAAQPSLPLGVDLAPPTGNTVRAFAITGPELIAYRSWLIRRLQYQPA